MQIRRRNSVCVALLLTVCVASCAHAAQPVPAAESATTVSIRNNWPDKFKDTLRYRRIAGTTYLDGRKEKHEFLATIDVVMHQRRGDVATLSWTYTHFTDNGKPLADLKLELSVTGEGAVELLNVEEVQRHVLQQARTQAKGDHAFDLGGEELAKMAGNKDVVANFYLRDAALFFYPLGTTVRRDEAVEFDNEAPGLGGETLKTVDRWKMLPERDLPAGTFAVEWKQEVDRHDVERYFAQLGQILGMKVDANKAQLSKSGLYALDRKTFWPHVVLASAKVSVQEGFSQLDLVDLRSKLLDPNWKH